MHGLRHPLLPPGVSAREPDSRLERPRLPERLAGGDRPPPRHEQLPGVHGDAVPRPVRGLVRPRDQRRPGDDQADRARDHRPGFRRRLDRARAAGGPHREAGRRGGLRAGRAGRRAAAPPRWPRGHRVRARRPDRRAPPVRDPRVQDGEACARPAPRSDAGRGGGVYDRGQRGGRRRSRASPPGSRRAAPDRGRVPGARPVHPRTGARGHPLRDGVPPAPEPALRGGRHPGRGLHHRA